MAVNPGERMTNCSDSATHSCRSLDPISFQRQLIEISARAGFEVHFLERRGSGLNASDRGDVDRYETWLDDLERYVMQLPNDVSKLLFGTSNGGKLATAFVRRRCDLVLGVALICPGLFVKKGDNVWQRCALPLAARTGLAWRQVDIPWRDLTLFTDAPHWQQYIRTDPLVLHQITIRFDLSP